MRWNIGEFYQLVQHKLPPSSVSSLEPPLGSVRWKFDLCRYHIHEANRILSEMFKGPKEEQHIEAIGKLFMAISGTDEGHEFLVARFCAEAHAIACAQSLHSTADILAQVLCISLNLDGLFKPKEYRYLQTVVNRMSQHTIAPSVVAAANYFLQSDEFRYLSAYVNTTKHISLIKSGYSIHVVPSEEQHGLKINAFSYRGENWPEKWLTDFIVTDFEQLSNMFGAIGIELTAFIRP
jgi:hypothetical protein